MNHPMIGRTGGLRAAARETRGVVRADRHEHEPTMAEDLNSLFGNLSSGTDD